MLYQDLSRIRVATHSCDHVYVRHLADPDGQWDVVRLADGSRRTKSGWRASWIVEHAASFDLVHAFIGLPDGAPGDPAHWLDTLRAFGKPLVVTLYDLPAPDTAADLAAAMLVDAAAAVITLTPSAAAQAHRRWGRHVLVLPHPHVVSHRWLTRPRPVHDAFVIGIHCDQAFPQPDEFALIETAAATLRGLESVRIRVDVAPPAAAPDGRLQQLAEQGDIEVRVRGSATGPDLFDALHCVDVSILPCRFGSHSWWLEACYDLGTTVIAPDHGYHAEQRACVSFRSGDEESLRHALLATYANRYAWRATLAERTAERREIAQTHERLYRAALRRSATLAGTIHG